MSSTVVFPPPCTIRCPKYTVKTGYYRICRGKVADMTTVPRTG